ncbi:MAG: DUF6503 family protein [Brumimicrobium sp.]|nr:DUF6503 family protein [Brumimicrobium sp.]
MKYNNVHIIITALLSILIACKNDSIEAETKQASNESVKLSAEEIIDRLYEAHGVSRLSEAGVSFKFRNHFYSYRKDSLGTERQRISFDSLGREVKDIWWRDELARTIDDVHVELDSLKELAYRNSINSVFYFAFLPKGLKDPAVNAELMGETSIRGTDYYKIKVTFDEEGGGQDHEDVFIYWISKKDFTMDFMAYKYLTNGGGIRFREAMHQREIKGIRFQDYRNYKPKNSEMLLSDTDKAFEKNALELVSEVVIEDIEVDFSATPVLR